MLLKIPLSFSSHSLQKQYPLIPYRIHAQFFLQSAQSLLLAKIKFRISTWLPEEVAMLSVRQFIPSDGLLSPLTLLFSFISKQLLKAAVRPYLLNEKIHLSLRDLFGNVGFIKTAILGLHLEELDVLLAFSTDQNAFVRYGLNGGKKWEVCLLRTALQECTAEEEKTGIKKICRVKQPPGRKIRGGCILEGLKHYSLSMWKDPVWYCSHLVPVPFPASSSRMKCSDGFLDKGLP